MANYDISKLFGNLNSNTNTFNFSDYAAIRNGSYRKLVKSYYALQKENTTVDKEETNKKTQTVTKDETRIAKVKTEADELKSSAKKLSNDDLWKQKNGQYDMEQIASAAVSFAKNYNDVIEQSKNAGTKDVSTQIGLMKNYTNSMSTSLSKIGITIDEDGKMSVNEDELKNAKAKDVKAMFSGQYSYASQITNKASAISSVASRAAGIYSGSGSWADTLAGMFDEWS